MLVRCVFVLWFGCNVVCVLFVGCLLVGCCLLFVDFYFGVLIVVCVVSFVAWCLLFFFV